MRRCHVSTEVRNVGRLLALILPRLSGIRARRRLTLKTVFKLALPQPSTNYLKKVFFFFIAEPDSKLNYVATVHLSPIIPTPHPTPHPHHYPTPPLPFYRRAEPVCHFVGYPSSPPHPWLLAGRNVYIKKVASSSVL